MKCNDDLCKNKASIIGKCSKCKKSFCNSHRLYEAHQCNLLDSIKKNDRQKLQDTMLDIPRSSKIIFI
jgi:predicted nucleic acid binding AN1-type Zn finger protein